MPLYVTPPIEETPYIIVLLITATNGDSVMYEYIARLYSTENHIPAPFHCLPLFLSSQSYKSRGIAEIHKTNLIKMTVCTKCVTGCRLKIHTRISNLCVQNISFETQTCDSCVFVKPWKGPENAHVHNWEREANQLVVEIGLPLLCQ